MMYSAKTDGTRQYPYCARRVEKLGILPSSLSAVSQNLNFNTANIYQVARIAVTDQAGTSRHSATPHTFVALHVRTGRYYSSSAQTGATQV